MLLPVLGLGKLARIRVTDGPITMPYTTLMQTVSHLYYFSFPSTFTLVLPVPLPLGYERREKVEQEAGVENKEVLKKRRKGMLSF